MLLLNQALLKAHAVFISLLVPWTIFNLQQLDKSVCFFVSLLVTVQGHTACMCSMFDVLIINGE